MGEIGSIFVYHNNETWKYLIVLGVDMNLHVSKNGYMREVENWGMNWNAVSKEFLG